MDNQVFIWNSNGTTDVYAASTPVQLLNILHDVQAVYLQHQYCDNYDNCDKVSDENKYETKRLINSLVDDFIGCDSFEYGTGFYTVKE